MPRQQSDVGLSPTPGWCYSSQVTKACVKVPPGSERLSGPDPYARSDADDEDAQVLDHKDVELWTTQVAVATETGGLRAWDAPALLGVHLPVPGKHPVVEVGLLVEVAAEYRECR